MKHFLLFLIFLSFICNLLSCKKQTTSSNLEYYQFNLLVENPILIGKKYILTLQEITADSTKNYRGSIERRGGFSISFDKYSYEIDLINDVSIANLPADDDWILNANYIDKTFMRHVFAYTLFQDMHPNNKASQSKYVVLNRNNRYEGLYILMEKLDKSSLKIDDNDKQAVIFKEPPLFITGAFTPQNADNYFQQIYPKKKKLDKTAFIAGVQNFIRYSENDVFHQEISSFFDIDNIIDWHLLLLLTNNNDGILKNFYLYKVDEATPLRVAPWDYDHSLGRDGDNELNLIRPLKMERSILFKRLLSLDWYKKALKKRWSALNTQGLFNLQSLNLRIDEFRKVVDVLVEKNFDKWPVNSEHYYDDNDFKKEVALIKKYLALRHEQLTKYFENLN